MGPGDEHCRSVCFKGPFQGREIVWFAHIRARGAGNRSYIRISDIGDSQAEIEIGLPVARIDTPTIKKTIVMIRQYKHLRPGRHDFGAV